jgi:hypothetical protein
LYVSAVRLTIDGGIPCQKSPFRQETVYRPVLHSYAATKLCDRIDKVRCDFIISRDETLVSRGARAVMDQLHKKVADKGLLMQSRKSTSWGEMGGAAPSLFLTPLAV